MRRQSLGQDGPWGGRERKQKLDKVYALDETPNNRTVCGCMCVFVWVWVWVWVSV